MSDLQQVRHTIQATAQEVFDAWVTPAAIEEWWGPDGFTTVVRELNLVEGGRFAFDMTAPDGTSCCMTGSYRQIQPPNSLVFEVVDHCNLCLPDGVQPQLNPSIVTVHIVERGESSEVVVSQTSLRPTYRPIATVSWSHTLNKLAKHLA